MTSEAKKPNSKKRAAGTSGTGRGGRGGHTGRDGDADLLRSTGEGQQGLTTVRADTTLTGDTSIIPANSRHHLNEAQQQDVELAATAMKAIAATPRSGT